MLTYVPLMAAMHSIRKTSAHMSCTGHRQKPEWHIPGVFPLLGRTPKPVSSSSCAGVLRGDDDPAAQGLGQRA